MKKIFSIILILVLPISLWGQVSELNRELGYAIANNDLNMVRNLVSQGADINAKAKYGNSALLLAVTVSKNLDVVKFLVEKGADVNATDKYGITALGYAHHSAVVSCLRSKGAK